MDALTSNVVLSSLVAGSALVAAGVYILYGAPWESGSNAGRGGKGLRNLGNTCFINAVLQALASLPEFAGWVLQSSEGRYGRLYSSLADIFSSLNSVDGPEESLETREVVNALASHGWVINFRQQDAHELFQVLMSTLEEELTACKGGLFCSLREDLPPPAALTRTGSVSSPIRMSPFQGLIKSQLKCLQCKHKFQVRIEAFESLSLPIHKNKLSFVFDSSLEQCLQTFTENELVEDVCCEECSKNGTTRSTCSKTLSIARAPKCLCVHLQRVTWSSEHHLTKTERFVRFPLQLDLSPYSRLRPSQSRLYQLAAVLVHFGEVNSGHYVTYRWLPGQRWLYTSDSHTRGATVEEVLNCSAYMLLYHRHAPHH